MIQISKNLLIQNLANSIGLVLFRVLLLSLCIYWFLFACCFFSGAIDRLGFEDAEDPQVDQAQEYQDPLTYIQGESIL